MGEIILISEEDIKFIENSLIEDVAQQYKYPMRLLIPQKNHTYMFNDQIQPNPVGEERIKDAISKITEILINDFPPVCIVTILDGVHKMCQNSYICQIEAKEKDLAEFKNLAQPLLPNKGTA